MNARRLTARNGESAARRRSSRAGSVTGRFLVDDHPLEEAHRVEPAVLVRRLEQEAGAVQIDQVEVARGQRRAAPHPSSASSGEPGRRAPLALDAPRRRGPGAPRRRTSSGAKSTSSSLASQSRGVVNRMPSWTGSFGRMAVDARADERDAVSAAGARSGPCRASAGRCAPPRGAGPARSARGAWKSQFGKDDLEAADLEMRAPVEEADRLRRSATRRPCGAACPSGVSSPLSASRVAIEEREIDDPLVGREEHVDRRDDRPEVRASARRRSSSRSRDWCTSGSAR